MSRLHMLQNLTALEAVEFMESPTGKKIVKQPRNSMICGQCSMAMITGAPIEEIIRKVELHPNGGTTANGRDKVLKEYMDDVFTVFGIDNRRAIDLNGTGILSIQFGRTRSGHALAFEDGKIYDPAGRYYENIDAMRRCYKERGKKIRVFAITYATPRKLQLSAASDT